MFEKLEKLVNDSIAQNTRKKTSKMLNQNEYFKAKT